MPEQPLCICSVNLHRSSLINHSLLQDSPFDILLLQECWFGQIGVNRSDTDPMGDDMRGHTINDMWEVFTPTPSLSGLNKVATAIRKSITNAPGVVIRPRYNLLISSPSSIVVDISLLDSDYICFINIYHSVPTSGGGHGLHHVLDFKLDPTVPTVVAGDFNMHGSWWSLPGAMLSPWASALKDWLEANELTVQNPPEAATWEGTREQRPSVLDLVFFNTPTILSGQFSEISISFGHSLGSDHTALHFMWTPLDTLAEPPTKTLPGFSINDNLRETWEKDFRLLPQPPPPSSVLNVSDLAATLLHDINRISLPLFPRRC